MVQKHGKLNQRGFTKIINNVHTVQTEIKVWWKKKDIFTSTNTTKVIDFIIQIRYRLRQLFQNKSL